jgi:hypothetical protein
MEEPAVLIAKVQVLLAEHASLRAEIVARIGHVYQLIGAGVTVLTVLLITLNPFKLTFLGNVAGRSDQKRSQILFASMAVLFLCVFVWSTASYVRDANRIAQRLREIEIDVNDRLKEDLLVWENLWGDSATGFWWWGEPLPRSHLGDVKPPSRTYRGKEIAPETSPTK